MKYPAFIALLVFIEICCHNILSWWIPIEFISVLYVGMGVLILGLSYNVIHNSPSPSNLSNRSLRSYNNWWLWGAIVVILMIAEDTAKVHFSNSPLDYRSAGMLPVIKVMSERFVAGEAVYSTIPEIWGGMQPIYLPAMWMPFVIPAIMDFDLRWLTVIFSCTGIIAAIFYAFRQRLSITSIAIVTALGLVFLGSLLHLDFVFYTLTEEGIVIGYYGLLCYFLLADKPRLLGITIALCLLSRYALAPWLISFSIFLWISHDREKILKAFIPASITTIFLLIVSGGYREINLFLSLSSNYVNSTIADPAKYRPLIGSSLGLVKFVGQEHIALFHNIFKILVFTIPTGFYIWMYFAKVKKHLFPIVGLLGLKLTLVVFYNLIIMPYPYLFYVSTIVSIFIAAETHRIYRLNKTAIITT